MGKKSYTQEFKNEAIKLAEKNGIEPAAKDLGISSGALRSWKNQKINPKMKSLEEAERERVSQEDQRGSKKKPWNFCPGPSQRFEIMRELSGSVPVAFLCRHFDVSRSGYYAFKPARSQRRQTKRDYLKQEIKRLFEV
jgi:hypothetical protein